MVAPCSGEKSFPSTTGARAPEDFRDMFASWLVSLKAFALAEIYALSGGGAGRETASAVATVESTHRFTIYSANPYDDVKVKVNVSGTADVDITPPVGCGPPPTAYASVDANLTLTNLTSGGSADYRYYEIKDSEFGNEGDSEGAFDWFLTVVGQTDEIDYEISMFASAAAITSVSACISDRENSIGESADAAVQFGNTVAWGGLELLNNGVPLDPADYSAIDSDGFNWAEAVAPAEVPSASPLAHGFMVLVVGLAAVLRLRRIGRSQRM